MKVSDEMIMAYVDGELDEKSSAEIDRMIADDPQLAGRAEVFRASRRLVRAAFEPELTQPPPEKLVAATQEMPSAAPQKSPGAEEARIVAFPRRRMMMAALPVAASLAVAFGLAGYWIGQTGASNADLLGPSSLARALGEVPAGESRTVTLGRQEAVLSTDSAYRVSGGVCRIFHLSGQASSIRGVGCARGDEAWTVDLAIAGPSPDAFAPASAGLVESIDTYLDSLEAEPLPAEEDAQFRR